MVNLEKEIENEKKKEIQTLILTLTLPWICFIQNNDFEKDQIAFLYENCYLVTPSWPSV